jgi:pepF/M3 family oligoendopeptidase
MTVVYPSLDSPEFEAGDQALIQAIDKLVAYFDEQNIQRLDTPPPVDASTVQVFETLLPQFNDVMRQLHTHSAYITSFIATDSRNTLAQSKWSELQQQELRLAQLETRFVAWIGGLDVEALIAQSPIAKDHAFALRKAHIEAQHQMSPVEEELAEELNLTGGKAWAKLYNNFSSQVNAEIELDGEVKTMPITAIRNLAYDPDREVRRNAYTVELAAWERHALPIAAALNSIKGQMLTLNQHRDWDTPLDVALFNNNIDHQTLDAMLNTARAFFPHFRRYLKAKACILQIPQLAWYDIFAPVGAEQSWTFEASRAFIIEQFGTYTDNLASLAKRAFDERWIDAEPRDGKRGGAFCQWLRADESRILCNFESAYGGMSTMAHELGHAYHNLARAGRTYIQRQTPMTLAETASIFCQILVRDAALKQASLEEQLAILEASLQSYCQVIVDITSRFDFEREVFEKRHKRELNVEDLNALMLQAQRNTYGEGLDPEQLHPYMWAVKPHYYSRAFYNFPYMFGLLFGLGLYARYQDAPARFKSQYDALLSATGMDNAADLAAGFDIDIRQPDFWRTSLQIVKADIDHFEQLVKQHNQPAK